MAHCHNPLKRFTRGCLVNTLHPIYIQQACPLCIYCLHTTPLNYHCSSSWNNFTQDCYEYTHSKHYYFYYIKAYFDTSPHILYKTPLCSKKKFRNEIKFVYITLYTHATRIQQVASIVNPNLVPHIHC